MMQEDKDEFDLMQNKKTLKDKLGSPEDAEKKGRKKKDGLKQTKLNFKKKSPDQKGNTKRIADLIRRYL